jgi:DNA-directed RNA polymerase subunit RPC12/RpoP
MDDFDDDYPDEDEDESTVPCPYCKREIHEDAQRCPYCEHYIFEEDAPPARKPWWIVAGVIVCLYVVFRWITG